jgi:Sulfotransferase family
VRGYLFIVGSARTGSTLLRHVLNRAPEVCLASETHFFRWARHAGLADQLADVQGAASSTALARLSSRFFEPDFWIWLRRNATPEEFAERLGATDLSEQSVFALLLDMYAERRCGLSSATGVLGEKTPSHLAEVSRLREWFPSSRVIHTFRDPRAIYASQLRRLREGRWGPKSRYSWLPGRIIDPVLAPAEAVRTAVGWRAAASLHRRYAASLGDAYRLVRFEDLVTRPAEEIERLCDFIGVPFRPDMLEGIDVVGSSFHAARHASSGFDTTTSSRWRSTLGPMAKRWFSTTLGGELQRFGYEP